MKNWKYILHACFLCGLQVALQAQQSLLAKYDFSKGGYTLLVLDRRPDHLDYEEGFTEGFDIPPDPDAPVYFDEVQTLRAIQSALSFQATDIVRHDYCYSDKTMQICKGGHEVENLGYSGKCSSVLADTADYFYLGSFDLEGAKPAKLRLDDFSDVKRARFVLDSIRHSPDLIWFQEPNWVDYEGLFSFNVEVGQRSEQQCKDSVMTHFAQRFPDEKFKVSVLVDDFMETFFTETVVPEYSVHVTCSASLWRKFGETAAVLPAWNGFPLTLQSYWK